MRLRRGSRADAGAGAVAGAVAEADPLDVALLLGGVRTMLGVGMILAPRLLTRPALKARAASPDAVTVWRMNGGREIAVGLGTLLAARRRSPAVRGWLEAGALADGVDVLAMATDRSLRGFVRAGLSVSASSAAAAGVWAARRLGEG